MTDTAQPQVAAAETELASRDGALRAAADAFEISLGQVPTSTGTGAPARHGDLTAGVDKGLFTVKRPAAGVRD